MLKNNGFHNRHTPVNRIFNPVSLFANGEQGWIYDPSNMATLFQDSAGTTPVTAMEQPVGLQLDLSGRNNHRFQVTSGSRPVVSARVNLFVGTETLATQTITTRATAHTLTFTGAGSITLTGTAVGMYAAGTYSITTTAGSLTATVLGAVNQADIRETNQGVGIPSYQRVTTSTDYETTGFPVYIRANGTNQWMLTNSIDFSATNKMTVWQGFRKRTSGVAVAIEFSATVDSNPNAFNLASDAVSGNSWYFSTGSIAQGQVYVRATTYTAPITNVIAVSYDRAGTGSGQINPRVNTLTPSLAYVGTGSTSNFGTYPVYFYARSGPNLLFSGNDYGSIARGAASTAAQIEAGEIWINQRTKAY